MHLVRRRYGLFIAFVVHNEQETKTFTCISYDVQKNTVPFQNSFVLYITSKIVYILKNAVPYQEPKRDHI